MNVQGEVTQVRPPNLISALLAGFDSVTSHMMILILPIFLDLFIWVGPRLKLTGLINQTFAQLGSIDPSTGTDVSGVMLTSQELWQSIGERINLFSALRSLPVGVASLMASSLPVDSPISSPAWELETWLVVFLTWLVLGAIGLFMGTLYFLVTAKVALENQVNLRTISELFPWTYGQVLILTVIWLGGIILLSIPASVLVSLVLSVGSLFGQLILLMIGGFLLWLFFPLIFSLHGIFTFQLRVFPSIRKSIQTVQLTLPMTALFVLCIFVIDQGLGLLWQIPVENSWLVLLGIFGHAFVATGLLAASFIYYRDADRWVSSVLKRFGTG
jgi:hypothetical protein